MTTYFTSDTHFGHKNIIKYCDRPFYDVRTMNRELIRRWNEVVKEDDMVYHLGDFAFLSIVEAAAVVRQLNGFKILVRGNHDRKSQVMSEMGFDIVTDKAYYQGWKMQHIPWEIDHKDKGLCGHVHEKWLRHRNLINVGIDQWDFYPVTLEKLQTAIPDKLVLNSWDTTAGHGRSRVS